MAEETSPHEAAGLQRGSERGSLSVRPSNRNQCRASADPMRQDIFAARRGRDGKDLGGIVGLNPASMQTLSYTPAL